MNVHRSFAWCHRDALENGKVEKILELLQSGFRLLDLKLGLNRNDSAELRNRKLGKRNRRVFEVALLPFSRRNRLSILLLEVMRRVPKIFRLSEVVSISCHCGSYLLYNPQIEFINFPLYLSSDTVVSISPYLLTRLLGFGFSLGGTRATVASLLELCLTAA